MDQQVHLTLSKESLWHMSNYLCYTFLQESSKVVKGLKTSQINGKRVHFPNFNRLVYGDWGLWVMRDYREYFPGNGLTLSPHNQSSEAVGNVLSFILVMASSQKNLKYLAGHSHGTGDFIYLPSSSYGSQD